MHRLDTDTSGCLLFARSPKARALFQQAFEARQSKNIILPSSASEIAREEGIDRRAARQESERRSRLADGRRSRRRRPRRRAGGASRCATAAPSSSSGRRPGAPTKSACTRARRSGAGSSATGSTAFPAGRCCSTRRGWSSRERASRRSTSTAPLPDYFGEWRRCGLRTSPFRRTRSAKASSRRPGRAGRTSTRSRPRSSCASTCSVSGCIRMLTSG